MNSVMMFVASFSPDMDIAIKAMLIACVSPFAFTLLARALLKPKTQLYSFVNAAKTKHLETLPIFLASVIVAMFCFVPQNVINVLACLYVLLSIGYQLAYICQRSLIYLVLRLLGMACCLALFCFAIMLV